MLFRLKNHLIWTPKDFPFTRRSWTKKPIAGQLRPGGMYQPPERFDFYESGQCRRGQPRTTPFCFISEPVWAVCAEPDSLSNPFYLPQLTIHLLPQPSTSLFSLYTHLHSIWTPDSESLRRRALGRTVIFKLPHFWFLGLHQIQPSNQPSSYLYVRGRNSLTSIM